MTPSPLFATGRASKCHPILRATLESRRCGACARTCVRVKKLGGVQSRLVVSVRNYTGQSVADWPLRVPARGLRVEASLISAPAPLPDCNKIVVADGVSSEG